MNFDKQKEINTHYGTSEDHENSSSKRRNSRGTSKSRDTGKYSAEEMKIRKQLQHMMYLKFKDGPAGLQRYDAQYYLDMSTAELRQKVSADDLPTWAPGAPHLCKPPNIHFPLSQF